VEALVNRWMFQEKYELFRRIENLRNDLMNVIDVRDLVPGCWRRWRTPGA
jgi:hypothetical protein